jgi:hypothetical protein
VSLSIYKSRNFETITNSAFQKKSYIIIKLEDKSEKLCYL